MTAQAVQAAAILKQRLPNFTPKLAIMLGSGLASLATDLQALLSVAYDELPGFYSPCVAGHKPQMVLGNWQGVDVVCLQGRAHLYEGISADVTKNMVRTCRLLGCDIWFATNAAGALREDFAIGGLVAVSDHLNFQFSNPLFGKNDDAFGPRFIAMENAYDKELRYRLAAIAKQQGVDLKEGVYLASSGPSFETPAEIRGFRILGADLVGMSTVPEVIIARHCGMRVACVSVVSNLAAGLHSVPLSHEETLNGAAKGQQDLLALLRHFLRGIHDTR